VGRQAPRDNAVSKRRCKLRQEGLADVVPFEVSRGDDWSARKLGRIAR
jgi:hypothetical protein